MFLAGQKAISIRARPVSVASPAGRVNQALLRALRRALHRSLTGRVNPHRRRVVAMGGSDEESYGNAYKKRGREQQNELASIET
jgi:hypothetical protein